MWKTQYLSITTNKTDQITALVRFTHAADDAQEQFFSVTVKPGELSEVVKEALQAEVGKRLDELNSLSSIAETLKQELVSA